MKARNNPFATWRLEQLQYRLDGPDWNELLGRFDRLGRRAALVGVHGSGNTTLLDEFAARFRQQGMHVCSFRLTQDEPDFGKTLDGVKSSGLGRNDIVLLDGAEQLNRSRWQKFLQFTGSAGGVLITMHRAGRLPTLYECRTNPRLLASLMEELAGGFEWPAARNAAELFHKHRGNVREALRELYDVFAEG